MEPIKTDEFLKKIVDPEGLIKIFPIIEEIEYIVSPRDIKEIEQIFFVHKDYLKILIKSIGILTNQNIKVYKKCKISIVNIDPNILYLGQKYVYRKNYSAILENFPNLFKNFCLPYGIAKLQPLIILGKDRKNNNVLSHYLPPIVEKHNDKLILMDGVHRNFIVKNVGTTIITIFIENVEIPFPCSVKNWSYIKVLSKKPKKMEDRYFDLRKEFFRDLKGIGIDG